ncbi:MAG: NUDIX domain-containing protein, partial [Clostridia bacterium]|nr:NUDIX domain-containing protein [Clostridia bacterium]
MEIWDAYLQDGTKAGMDLVRGEPVPEGLYHLVSEVLVRHEEGDYLLMQRSFEKPNYPGFWEATAGGSALKGEEALSCAIRETREETGIANGKM